MSASTHPSLNMDASPHVDIDSQKDAVLDEVESARYVEDADLHLARAHAATNHQMLTVNVLPGQSVQVLGYDAARKKATVLTNIAGGVYLSLGDLAPQLYAQAPGNVYFTVSGVELQKAYSNLEIESSQALWLMNISTVAVPVSFIIERYAEGM